MRADCARTQAVYGMYLREGSGSFSGSGSGWSRGGNAYVVKGSWSGEPDVLEKAADQDRASTSVAILLPQVVRRDKKWS